MHVDISTYLNRYVNAIYFRYKDPLYSSRYIADLYIFAIAWLFGIADQIKSDTILNRFIYPFFYRRAL